MTNTIFKSFLFILISFGLSFQVSAKKTKLIDPKPINIKSTMSLDLINQAIKGGLINQGWANEQNSNDNEVDASLSIRSHQVTIKISYDEKQITFQYVKSTNMNFKAKKKYQYIHPNYLVWTNNLADQIKKNINKGDSYDYEKDMSLASKLTNPAPDMSFSQFSKYTLKGATLAKTYQGNKGNESTVKNLNHNLNLSLGVRLDALNTENKSGKTLIIQPHIKAVRFIGTGARFWTGMMAGASWMYVSVDFIDEESGKMIAQPELFRRAVIGNGWSMSKNDYKMVEDMASDIGRYFEMNYKQAVGGGTIPTTDERRSIKK